MLTRGPIRCHTYNANFNGMGPYSTDQIPGFVRAEMVKGVLHTWAVTRPTSRDSDSPYWLCRGGDLPLSLSAETVEMDPSNRDTWRRTYVFDQNPSNKFQ